MNADLAAVETWARQELERKNAIREHALRLSREMVRACANSIRAVHRHELENARLMSSHALTLHREIRREAEPSGDVYWAGYVQDAQKELVEALSTYALVQGEALPLAAELGITAAPYLNGLAEAVGELRRYILDLLRRGEAAECEPLLTVMDDIYGVLVSIDYPDALTGGLRRSTDTARATLERTRGDLTLALRQDAVQRALAESTRDERLR